MATYTELVTLFNNDVLRNRIEVAVIVKAHDIINEATPTAERIAWARSVLSTGSYAEAQSLLKYALAANKAATVQTILGATDEVLSTVVGAAVDAIYPTGA
jgi:hypothetical protein